MTELLLIQLASYRPVPTREIEYQLDVLIDLIYYPIFLVLFLNTPTFFYAFYCIAPAAWIKVLSFDVCFKSVASFNHPRYLLELLLAPFHVREILQPDISIWITHFCPREMSEISFLRLRGLNRWKWLVNFVDWGAKLTPARVVSLGSDLSKEALFIKIYQVTCRFIYLLKEHIHVTTSIKQHIHALFCVYVCYNEL